MEAATFVLFDELALLDVEREEKDDDEEKDSNDDGLGLEVEREEEVEDNEEDGNDDGLGSFKSIDSLLPSNFPVPPASVIIFRYSALSLAFCEAATVFAFDGVAFMEVVEEEDDDDEGIIPFPC